MAGATLHVKVDDSRLAIIAAELEAIPEQVEKAMRSAINRTVKWMQTRARRALMDELNIPSKVIRARLRYALYNIESGRGRVWFGLDPVSVMRLSPRQTKTGVTARGEQYQHAFIARGRNGNKHVFIRTGKGRKPLEAVYKDLATGTDVFENHVFEGWDAFLYQRFEHELQWQKSKT